MLGLPAVHPEAVFLQEPLVDLLGGEALPARVVREDERRLEPFVREEEMDLEVGGDVEERAVAVLSTQEVQQRAVPDLVGEDEEPLRGVQLRVEVDVDEDAVAVRRRRLEADVAHRHEVEPHHERARERQLHQELLPVLRQQLGDGRLARRYGLAAAGLRLPSIGRMLAASPLGVFCDHASVYRAAAEISPRRLQPRTGAVSPRRGRSTKGQQDTRTKGRAPRAEGTKGHAIRSRRRPKIRNPGARAAQARRIRQWRIRNRRCEADGVASACQ